MRDILGRGKEDVRMQMMVDEHEEILVCVPGYSEPRPLKEALEKIEDGTVFQIPLEGMVLKNGQKTE